MKKMKKLNRTETRILASRMLNAEVNRAVEKAENSPQIKSKIANATKLLKEWVKEKHKAKQKEHAFKKFVEDNIVLIEGGFVSNSGEEKNLKSPSYRKKIADGIYKAIIKFKASREKVLAEE